MVKNLNKKKTNTRDIKADPKAKDAFKKLGTITDPTDLIAQNKKQYIEIYHVPSGKSVYFKAFLEMFEDQFSSEWEKTPVFGRMDPLVNFQGTQRIMSLGWNVPSFGEADAERNLQKCSLLMSMLYPVYQPVDSTSPSSANTLMSPPIFKLKMMNLITDASGTSSNVGTGTAKDSGLLGVISGFTYSPILEEGVIEKSGTHNLFPQSIKLQCEFTVLHTHQLGWKTDGERAEKAYPYLAKVELE